MQKVIKCLLLGVAFHAVYLGAAQCAFAEDANDNGIPKNFDNPFGAEYTSKPQEDVEAVADYDPDTSYEPLVMEAVALHNMVQLVDGQINNAKGFEYAVWDKTVDQERIKDFDACEVTLLSEYFKQPEELWKKLKGRADELLQEYNATAVEQVADVEDRVAEAMSLSEADRLKRLEELEKSNKKIEVNEDEVLSQFVDASIEWQVGFVVLNSFYPNQDAWAERLTKQTPSLPLWTDQKYLYNRDVWKPKYQAIVDHCKKQDVKLKMKEPEIKDNYKYDYYFYDKVEKAHNVFTKAAMAQKCILTKAMKEPPQKAPAPLPPVYEEIIVLPHTPMAMKKGEKHETFPENDKIPVMVEERGNIAGVYPQIPQNPVQQDREKLSDAQIQNTAPEFVENTVWEVYKNEDFEDIPKEGSEFRIYFEKDLKLTDAVTQQKGNRISKYFLLKNTAEMSQNVYDSFVEMRDELKGVFNDVIATYELDVSKDLDYLKVDDLQKLRQAILKKKQELVTKARQIVGKNEAMQQAAEAQAQNQENEYVAAAKTATRDTDAVSALNKVAVQYTRQIAENDRRVLDKTENTSVAETTAEMLQGDRYLAFLNALEKDTEAIVLLTQENAVAIDDALKQATADRELLNLYSSESDRVKMRLLKEKNHHADEKTCLDTKSGAVLVDLSKVEIK